MRVGYYSVIQKHMAKTLIAADIAIPLLLAMIFTFIVVAVCGLHNVLENNRFAPNQSILETLFIGKSEIYQLKLNSLLFFK